MNWILALLALTMLVQVNANPLQFVDKVVDYLKDKGISEGDLVGVARVLDSLQLVGQPVVRQDTNTIEETIEGIAEVLAKGVPGLVSGVSDLLNGVVKSAAGTSGSGAKRAEDAGI